MLRVEDYFVYSPDTGEVVWSKSAKGARCVPGRRVGTPDKNGYLTVKVRGTTWKVHRNNTSGFKGVTFDRGNIRAQITVRGKHYSKSGFKTVEDAAKWYQHMSSTLHGEFSEWTSRGLEPASA